MPVMHRRAGQAAVIPAERQARALYADADIALSRKRELARQLIPATAAIIGYCA
jgi:hypothetical protein